MKYHWLHSILLLKYNFKCIRFTQAINKKKRINNLTRERNYNHSIRHRFFKTSSIIITDIPSMLYDSPSRWVYINKWDVQKGPSTLQRCNVLLIDPWLLFLRPVPQREQLPSLPPSQNYREYKEENVGSSPLFPETVIPQQWDTEENSVETLTHSFHVFSPPPRTAQLDCSQIWGIPWVLKNSKNSATSKGKTNIHNRVN